MIKKILFLFLFSILLAVVALAYFIATFDADKYVPLVEKKLEEAIGNPVKIGHLSLTWSGGIAFEIRQLEIFSSHAPGAPPALRLEEASALLRLAPLLQKDVKIGSLRLVHPSLRIVRDRQGEIRVVGIEPAQKSSGAETAAVSVPFLIDTVKVQDAEVIYTDEAAPEPLQIAVKDIDLTLKNVSVIQPIAFDVKASVMSRGQNIHATGRFLLPIRNGVAALEGFHFETDLSEMDVAELTSFLPQAAEMGLREPLRGKIDFAFDRLSLDPQGLEALVSKARLSGGEIHLAALNNNPVENLNVQLSTQGNRLGFEQFSAQVAGGDITGSGTVEYPFTQPLASFETAGGTFNLEKLTQAAPNEPRLDGQLSWNFRGTARGLDALSISQSLSGQGQARVQNAVLRNFNLLREVFDRLSVIPSVVRRLEEKLPPEYLQKLEERDTVLGPIELPVTANRGLISFPNIGVQSEIFRLTGRGVLQPGGLMDFQLLISIDPQLSLAMIQSVEELRYLANPDGWLEIPLVVQGTANHIQVLPNLQYVASRLALTKTQEFIGDLLKNKNPQSTQPSSQPAWGSMLGTLFEQQTSKNDPSSQSTTT